MSFPMLRIRNWQKYQHYSKRRPPWIKLHFSTLSSKDWVMSDECTRLLAIVCMLVASQSEYKDGRFEADPGYFQIIARFITPPDFKPLIDIRFLEFASAGKQTQANATPETETEAEAETYTEKPRLRKPQAPSSPPNGQEQIVLQKLARLAREHDLKVAINAGSGPR